MPVSCSPAAWQPFLSVTNTDSQHPVSLWYQDSGYHGAVAVSRTETGHGERKRDSAGDGNMAMAHISARPIKKPPWLSAGT